MITKTIYWTIRKNNGSSYVIQFWSKPDKSNAIVTTFVSLEESKMRERITNLLGIKKFELKQVK